MESTKRSFDKTEARKLAYNFSANQKKMIHNSDYVSFVVPWQIPAEKDERNKKTPSL